MDKVPAIWYQSGNWPLVGAILSLTLTWIVGFIVTFWQTRQALRNQRRTTALELAIKRLHEFYDPLYNILLINGRAFAETGPSNFPTETIARNAAAAVWDRIRADVILPNNALIERILKEKCHLLAEGDDILEYMPLLLHISMYKIFLDTPTELYSKFQFPRGALRHIEVVRERVLDLVATSEAELVK